LGIERVKMADQKAQLDPKRFEIKRLTFLRALLPNSRTAELKVGVITILTREGYEMIFREEDVKAMQAMFDEERKILGESSGS
jgi:hypothetical protein